MDTHTLWIQQAVRSGRIDLRKIKGEENPADRLTKHSLSKAKLEYLVTFFGCGHCEGRPLSAPQLRRGESTKLTLAKAAGDVQAVDGGDAEDPRRIPPGVSNRVARTEATTQEEIARQNDPGNSSPGRVISQASESTALDETFPRTPHLELSEEEMDALHPRLLAPTEEPLHDLACDGDGYVYQRGLRIVEELQ